MSGTLAQKETAQVANKTSVKLELKSESKLNSKPVAAKANITKMANETAAKPMAVVAKPIATSANATISKKNETQKLAQTGQNRAMQTNISKNATKVVPKVSKTKIQQKGSSELSSDSNSAPVSNTFTQEVTWGENTDLVIETAAPEVQKEQSLATAHEKE